MNFTEAVKTCFKKYGTFSGRASRSEYWYFILLVSGSILLFVLLGIFAGGPGFAQFIPLMILLYLGVFVPIISVTARRLHDINKSGWWQLIGVIPYVGIIGGIVLLVWYCSDGEKKDNRFGKNIYKKRRKRR